MHKDWVLIHEDTESQYFKEPVYHCCCFTREATGRCDHPQFTIYKKDKGTGSVTKVDLRTVMRLKRDYKSIWSRVKLLFTGFKEF